MTHSENPVVPACVSASDAVPFCPNPVPAADLHDAICVAKCKTQPLAYQADLRSPADVYHSEAYLIGWLVKLYGWRVVEPGTLRRAWRPAAPAAELPASSDQVGAPAPAALEVA